MANIDENNESKAVRPDNDIKNKSEVPIFIPKIVSTLFLNPHLTLSLIIKIMFGPGTTIIITDANIYANKTSEFTIPLLNLTF
jgi:hypothetical protein